ncbi:tudor domain-containing protein 5-like isoform X2 [Uranotaenia lowii]|uniref:tudor domain-containing protein 5-like isoform X2 n=1 Tax=Uranotaenia lowii TaxID=190385 RepID=UPI002479920B|nr:tudor domain-containing protein 5-like isoform X2 [Uranotaenia lowii]
METYSMDALKKIIRSIAISAPAHGLSVSELARDFKNIEGFDLPYKRMGFNSVDTFLLTMPDVVRLDGYGPSATVKPIVTESNKHIREFVQASKNNARRYRTDKNYKNPHSRYRQNNISNNYSRNMHNNQTVQRYGNSSNDDQPRKVYNREFDFTGSLESNGSDSDSSDSLPKFKLNENKTLEQVAVKPEPPTQNAEISRSSEAIPDNAILTIVNMLEVPNDALGLGDKVPEPLIPNDIQPKQSVRIFITEVHNPNRMWFHLADNAEKIDELMSEIDLFYSGMDWNEWRLQPSNVMVGLYCIARYMGVWHRARVVSNLMNGKVKVFYIDYGTVADLELRDTKFMAKCFAELPAQAMRASMAYVSPLNKKWSREAALTLLSFVYDKILYAYVVDVSDEREFMDVVLIDTNGSKDKIINKQLFVKGHAIWEDDVSYKEESFTKKLVTDSSWMANPKYLAKIAQKYHQGARNLF